MSGQVCKVRRPQERHNFEQASEKVTRVLPPSALHFPAGGGHTGMVPVSNPRTEPSGVSPATPELDSEKLDYDATSPVSPEVLRAALECMPDSVVITASEGRVLYANPAARQLRPAEITKTNETLANYGLFWADGVTPLSPNSTPATRALAGELVRDTEVVRRLPGSAEQSFRVNASLIRDASGATQGVVSVGRENTRARAARQALVNSEALFRTVVRNLPNGAVLVFDHDLRYLLADGEALLESVGFSSQALVGKTLSDVATPQHFEALAARYRAALAGESQGFEAVRGPKTFALDIVPVRDELGGVTAGVVLVYDVTSHKQTEAALLEQTLLVNEEAASVEILQAIAAAANSAQTTQEAFTFCLHRVCSFMGWPIGHVYVRHGDVLRTSSWWNDDSPRFDNFREQSAALEFAADDDMIGQVLGSGLATWLSDLELESAFLRARTAGEAGIRSGFAFPVLIGSEVVAVLEFYSERREEPDLRLLTLMGHIGTQLGRVVERERARADTLKWAEEIRNLSIRDELTGLYNRRGFLELARHVIQQTDRARSSALLFFVDLNGMKQINDQLGHEEGDQALRETASVLRATFRASDVVARLGGDEFVALLPEASAEQLELFTARIDAEIALRNQKLGQRYRLSASVGGTVYDSSHPESIEGLLVKADALMYEQKRARKALQSAAR
jgi:diguanylate cyclase (GGDEF)-like protein/PAS domain S-box-containing protein